MFLELPDYVLDWQDRLCPRMGYQRLLAKTPPRDFCPARRIIAKLVRTGIGTLAGAVRVHCIFSDAPASDRILRLMQRAEDEESAIGVRQTTGRWNKLRTLGSAFLSIIPSGIQDVQKPVESGCLWTISEVAPKDPVSRTAGLEGRRQATVPVQLILGVVQRTHIALSSTLLPQGSPQTTLTVGWPGRSFPQPNSPRCDKVQRPTGIATISRGTLSKPRILHRCPCHRHEIVAKI